MRHVENGDELILLVKHEAKEGKLARNDCLDELADLKLVIATCHRFAAVRCNFEFETECIGHHKVGKWLLIANGLKVLPFNNFEVG